MTFLHPLAMWLGVFAAAGPVVIHLLTRPKPTRMPLSTLRFVREAIQQRRSRSRLRDWLILALRTLAILLLAMAVARPQWGQRLPITGEDEGDAVRVVLLDVSQSMAMTDQGMEAIQRARTVAADFLRYRPGLRANLIVAAADARPVFDGPSTNFDALRDELAKCSALPQRFDVKRAIEAAARILAPTSKQDTRRRELVVVSDFQRDSWAGADFSLLPVDTQIQLESVAPAKPPGNLAILRVEGIAQSSRDRSVQLQVDIGNYTLTARKVTIEITLDDATWRLKGTCPAGRLTKRGTIAGGTVTLTEDVQLRRVGWQSGWAKLVGVDDAMAADNIRPVTVKIRPRPVYALITRQPAMQRLLVEALSSHFLECALVPDARLKERASAVVRRIDPADLDRPALAPADLILLDHPGRLSEESIRLLAGLMRRGRPILYVAGEVIDATNLKQLVDAAGVGLKMPVEFTPPMAGRIRRDLFLTSVHADQAPFNVFGDQLAAITGGLKFAGGLGSRKLDGGLQDDVLATYNDGTACMVFSTADAGVLAVINADLAASNLPKTAAFLPLMDELIERMFRRRGSGKPEVCGELLVANLPSDAGSVAGLRIVGPDENDESETTDDRYGRLSDEGVSVVWQWTSPDQPGAYRVLRDETTVFSIAINVPAEESSSEILRVKDLTGRLAGGREVYFHGGRQDDGRQDTFWRWCAALCAVCILGEFGALLGFRC